MTATAVMAAVVMATALADETIGRDLPSIPRVVCDSCFCMGRMRYPRARPSATRLDLTRLDLARLDLARLVLTPGAPPPR